MASSRNPSRIKSSRSPRNFTSRPSSSPTTLRRHYSGALYYDEENTIVTTSENLDLSAYGLDAANFTDGTLDENGILTPDTYPGTVTYSYTLANGETMTVYVSFIVIINEKNFPDETFRNYVDEMFDTTDDDILDPDEIAEAMFIDVSEMGITDLTGVEYFTALTSLHCYTNQLASLNVSGSDAPAVPAGRSAPVPHQVWKYRACSVVRTRYFHRHSDSGTGHSPEIRC